MNESTIQDVQKFEERSVAVVEPQTDNSFLATVERLASKPGIDVAVIQYFFDQREKDLNRNAKQAYNAAMVRVQAQMPSVVKNKDNTQTNSRYADFDAISKIAKPIYTKEGFAISFYEGFATPEKPVPDHHIRMVAKVMHEDGHTEIMEYDVPLDDAGIKGSVNKTGPHAKASSFQYGRRYMTCQIFGVSTGDDDDGNAGGGRGETITVDQETEINDLLVETKANVPAFLKWMKVDAVENIAARDYKKAITMLNAKKGKAA